MYSSFALTSKSATAAQNDNLVCPRTRPLRRSPHPLNLSQITEASACSSFLVRPNTKQNQARWLLSQRPQSSRRCRSFNTFSTLFILHPNNTLCKRQAWIEEWSFGFWTCGNVVVYLDILHPRDLHDSLQYQVFQLKIGIDVFKGIRIQSECDYQGTCNSSIMLRVLNAIV